MSTMTKHDYTNTIRGVASTNGGAADGRREKSRTRTADTAISYRGGPESRRRRRIPPCYTDLIIRPGEPIHFSPLVLPPVAAERIICATRCLVPGGVQAVCLWFVRWVRPRRCDDCDSSAVDCRK